MFSIEYLFRECNMHHKALGIDLVRSVILNEEKVQQIVLLEVKCSEGEAEQLTRNVLNGINTNEGVYQVCVSDIVGNPLNPQTINLHIDNIQEVWER